MPAIIELEEVRKTCRVGKVDVPALRSVSFSVENGEFVGIVGPVLDMLRQTDRELGQTVLMITHNPEAAAYGHRIPHMRDGLLVPPQDDPQWKPVAAVL